MTDSTSARPTTGSSVAAPPAQADAAPAPAAGRGERPAAGDAGPAPGSRVSFDAAQFIVALCIIGVYIASMWLMFQHRADQQWDRMVYLFTGFEAIVFVAAGAIFGTRIQRASVEAAHEQSRQAREDLHAERARADRAARLEEATATFLTALRAYQDEEPASPGGELSSTGNGPASGTSDDRIGRRGSDASTRPSTGRDGLGFAIKLAEELFPADRR